MRQLPKASVTVVIPTRDRPDDLRRALGSMQHQTHPDFHVVVMDQSDDVAPNQAIVSELTDARFTHYSDQNRGKSKALNEAILAADSAVIAFTDDDCELPVWWLERGLGILDADHRIGLLYGEVRPCPHDAEAVFIPAISFDQARTISGPLRRHRTLVGMGANMFAPRHVLVDTGLFDEDLGPGGVLKTGEESEFTYRLLHRGERSVRQEPELFVIHYGARPITDGTAYEHLVIADVAFAAGLGKHLRLREVRTLGVIADQLWWRSGVVTRSVLRGRRPFNLGYITALVRGLAAGWKVGPNWRSADGERL